MNREDTALSAAPRTSAPQRKRRAALVGVEGNRERPPPSPHSQTLSRTCSVSSLSEAAAAAERPGWRAASRLGLASPSRPTIHEAQRPSPLPTLPARAKVLRLRRPSRTCGQKEGRGEACVIPRRRGPGAGSYGGRAGGVCLRLRPALPAGRPWRGAREGPPKAIRSEQLPGCGPGPLPCLRLRAGRPHAPNAAGVRGLLALTPKRSPPSPSPPRP